MIEGINYYPKKKKSNANFFILVFLFLTALVLLWYYLSESNFNKDSSSSIIISLPSINVEDDIMKEDDISNKATIDLKQKSTENLDEVISTYEASTQN